MLENKMGKSKTVNNGMATGGTLNPKILNPKLGVGVYLE